MLFSGVTILLPEKKNPKFFFPAREFGLSSETNRGRGWFGRVWREKKEREKQMSVLCFFFFFFGKLRGYLRFSGKVGMNTESVCRENLRNGKCEYGVIGGWWSWEFGMGWDSSSFTQ